MLGLLFVCVCNICGGMNFVSCWKSASLAAVFSSMHNVNHLFRLGVM